ncbi:uncharacterized protein BX663DRAFT_458372 [Cokeromyces recurvatus]|uniref:uncharacterized protein n=1 Tax=Cokeromyces recurvatus TaxID=90255 RepID=UPI002220F594|nr:uncharacterized protein BX663DRAFT_458372 [Cokeromyces recurvatus]KAI7900652.1 hypothetical protein BX663DRAFT_458372 [Cokeromyces recurvatus]
MPPNVNANDLPTNTSQKTIVVVGLGMAAVAFMEKMIAYDTEKKYCIKVFGDEPELAYNRVGLTQYFTHRDPEKQLMKPRSWYDENQIEVHVGDLVEEIDTKTKMIRAKHASWVPYDVCVIATGSSAAVPPNAPTDMDGVFCYRTIEDLENIIDWASRHDVKTASVVGGGLLGLEAAKAVLDLDLKVSIYELSPRLMFRQLDQDASDLLENEIKKLGIETYLGKSPKEVHGQEDPVTKRTRLTGLTVQGDEDKGVVPTDMLIYSIGIRPRDQLCAASYGALQRGDRGGIKVMADMSTSAPDVYAIGECASFNNMCYGLVAPCNDMADVLAKNLTQKGPAEFKGNDMSTKLKLMGVYVASFGTVFPDPSLETQPLTYRDPFKSVYKKYIFTKDGKKLLGGIMVGDTNDYIKLLAYARSGKEIECEPSQFILGIQSGEAEGAEALPDETQICSCYNISKGEIRKAIREQGLTTVDQVKAYTKAGTGCGGCVPSVTEIFEAEMKALGKTVTNYVCRDFAYSRAELYTIAKIKGLRSYSDIVEHCAIDKETMGCEICKPTVASILASLYNENVLDAGRGALQETNDRYLANIQRGGLYSVVPRIAGGEITPEKLGVIADVAKEYNLYTKITGGQRIDIFGARKEDLPDIWEKLVNAGFESGHAYGKSLRTVKSCVGSTWCRYGQQDSVGFAIRLENRYKGIRSPHKLKGAVSGCIRECAEAQGKDFGLIATEQGYNVYVCGNGGSKPRHADLLVSNVSEEDATKYVDRFLIYYIMTADRLQRTARWLEKLPGGVDYLRKVVVDDHLGICEELDKHMSYLIGTYEDEWARIVKTPELRQRFKEYVNAESEKETMIEMIEERGQLRPANWPKELESLPSLEAEIQNKSASLNWMHVGSSDLFPRDEGRVVKVGNVQIAVFHTLNDHYYAVQNMCPIKRDLVLSDGILGEIKKEDHTSVYVSCPIHKKNFDLQTGACLSSGSENYSINAFNVKVENNQVYLLLPSVEILNEALSSERFIIKKSMTMKKDSSDQAIPVAVGDKDVNNW